MEWKRVGIYLIVVGLVSSFSNVALTGAVVGVGVRGFVNVFAIVLFFVGVVVLFISSTLEKMVGDRVVRPNELGGHYSFGDNSVFVIDNSLLSSYSGRDAKEVIRNLAAKGTLVVTDGTLREMEGSHGDVRELLIRSSEMPLDGYEEFIPQATEYLESSRKAFYHDEVIPIITGEKEAPASRKDAKKYIVPVKNLVESMAKDGKELTRENLRKEVEDHWAVSTVDAEVLAAAMAEVHSGREAFVGEKDIDFEDAIRTAGLDKLHYLNAYGKVA